MKETRIDCKFANCKEQKRPALVTFITAGDPDYESSGEILRQLVQAGADIIELGMPFSDPMAEGIPIQLSSQRALKSGQSMKKTLEMVKNFRSENNETPIVLMGYYNPIYSYGNDKFLHDANQAGVDGLIIVDLPPEADEELCIPSFDYDINFIRLATPTTDQKRLPTVLTNTSGFLYYVSITGITGTAEPNIAEVKSSISQIKKHTDLPIAVGFGVKTPEQAKIIGEFSDGVVVGSAIVSTIKESLSPEGKATTNTLKSINDLVSSLAASIKKARNNQN